MAMRKSYYEPQRPKLYLANSMSDSIEESDLRGLDLLLRHRDADPNFIMPEKLFSPMHLVAAIDDENFAVKALELLFANGGDPNVCGDESLTPVHIAASWDHAKVLHVLLENGGNPHLQDDSGKDSFDYVFENGCIQAKHVLEQYNHIGKLLVRVKKLQASLPHNVPSLGRRTRIFFRPSVLARMPDSPCANSSGGESVEIIEEIGKLSKSQVDDIQLPCLSVCNSGNGDHDDSVVFIEEVDKNTLSCKVPLVGDGYPLTVGSVADNSHNTYNIVDGGDLKLLTTPAEICRSNTLSFGVMENENSVLTSENHDTPEKNLQTNNCGVGESWKDTCANNDGSALFCKINNHSSTSKGISGIDTLPDSSSSDPVEPCEKKSGHLSVCYKREPRSLSLASFEDHEGFFSRESVAGKRQSLRRSLMPKKQIPRIIVTSDSNDIIHEESNEDDGLDVVNLLATSPRKTFDDKRLLDWINKITDNQIPDIELEKSKSLSDKENNLQLKSSSSDTYESCRSDTDSAGKLDIGAAGSDLHASSSVSSTGTCVSECYLYTDEENGIVLLEERWKSNPVLKSDAPQTDQSCSSHGVASTDTEAYDTESLRQELTSQGIGYGPITATTKRVYIKRLGSKRKLCGQLSKEESKFSFELQRSLRDGRNLFFVSLGSKLERQVDEEFSTCGGGDRRRWREGCNKTSFNYLLLDPRITQNLPWRAPELSPQRVWLIFLKSIFYVGKGKRSRPYSHLYEAVQHWNDRHPTRYMNKKVKQILDIWAEGLGVVCLHIFQNVIPVEAYTREAAMIDALGLDNLGNAKRSEYYGSAAQWISREQRVLGVYLLHKAMTIFVAEGERQIRPWDLHS